MTQIDIRTTVREQYGAMARAGSSCCGPSTNGCCAPAADPTALASAIGYDAAELARILPDGANLGLSCGNAFLCGPKVGATGRVIGVDMTPDMLAKARGNIAGYTARTGLANIEFRMGEIEHLPVADASVDVVISNCVINLSPDKPQVWREIARVLKPGGRVAVSDIVLLKPLPEAVATAINAYVGCIAGASLVDDLKRMMREAGFVKAALTPKSAYVETLTTGDDPLYQQVRAGLPAGSSPVDYITSMDIAAVKPGACCAPGCCV
jgi:SAM-dependent methyltransferase